jgi:hypothetical protein
MNKYKQVYPIDKSAAIAAFSSSNIETICNAMVAVALHEADWKWAQDKFLEFLEYDNPQVSGLSAICLGHLARIHRNIDKEKVMASLLSKLNDSKIGGLVEDAINDIEIFT